MCSTSLMLRVAWFAGIDSARAMLSDSIVAATLPRLLNPKAAFGAPLDTATIGPALVDPALIDAVLRAAPSRVVRPTPLAPDAVAVLVRARLGMDADDVFCAACDTAAHGNPLLLGELIGRLADERVPPTAEHVERVHTTIPGGLAGAGAGDAA